jgi:hypothetical protein
VINAMVITKLLFELLDVSKLTAGHISVKVS